MALIRRQDTWDPMREFEDFSNRFNRLFGGVTRGSNDGGEVLTKANWMPSCDVSEDEKEYRLQVALPNVKKDDVSVSVENDILTIQGERREEKEKKDVKFHQREIAYGSFVRRFTMPDNADESKVDAAFNDGVLNISIPKSEKKKPKAKQIAVH